MKSFIIIISFFCLSLSSIKADFDPEYVALINRYSKMRGERAVYADDKAASLGIKEFDCKIGALTDPRPTSVHALKPSDIEVIGAIGDSLTAANGAKATLILGLLEEFRGVSWSMGGENPDIKKLVTLPNIIRQFNPNLYGFSVGSGKNTSENARFNSAHPGDTSHEMYGQALSLVKNIKNSDKVDFQNSWKFINLFVGGNDLCRACSDTKKFSIQSFVNNIQKTLDYFQANLPRTLVNVVLSLDVREIQKLTGTTCRNMQKTFCKCVFEEKFKPTMDGLVKGYQRSVEDLISSGRYDTRDDFTVVAQPFMTQMTVPVTDAGAPDYSYFAPDCFHFSLKGHQLAGAELWNSLLTPVGKKPTKWNIHAEIKCPSNERPYIYTSKNSNTNANKFL